MKNYKNIIIIAAAVVIPGGFIALGLWKAYGLYKRKQAEKLAQPKNLQEFIEKLKAEVEEEESKKACGIILRGI